jgi:sirohydrochlorin ferrochelatase
MFHIALHQTVGKRRTKHRVVIYLAVDRDWGSLQLSRNGHKYGPLATAPMTEGAETYCRRSWRATSLQYTGVAPADAAGMADDLRTLGYDDAVIDTFLTAAAPYWADGYITKSL